MFEICGNRESGASESVLRYYRLGGTINLLPRSPRIQGKYKVKPKRKIRTFNNNVKYFNIVL